MSLDSPTIAILGAGPIGLEAALYGRFLGYDIQIYEQEEVGYHILQWGHVEWFTPFAMNHSPLAVAALKAQDANWRAPDENAQLTGRAYVEHFLRPLAETDLLAESLHLQTRVVSIGRADLRRADLGQEVNRDNSPFRLFLCDKEGRESVVEADIVIDATGVYGQHRFLGRGGVPAMGEQQASRAIDYRLPVIRHDSSSKFAGRHTLVVGGGYSAATSIIALAELAATVPETRVSWVVRHPRGREGPLEEIPNDRLKYRVALTDAANRLAVGEGNGVCYFPEKSVERVCHKEESASFEVLLRGKNVEEELSILCDFILAHTGFRPDCNIFKELQVQLCHLSEGPIGLAAYLLQEKTDDCLNQKMPPDDLLTTSEPHFYILGNKSYGTDARFLLSVGYEQIRCLFSLISENEHLNLYQTIQVDST